MLAPSQFRYRPGALSHFLLLPCLLYRAMLTSFRGDGGAAIFTNQVLMATLSQLVFILRDVAHPDLRCQSTSDDEFK